MRMTAGYSRWRLLGVVLLGNVLFFGVLLALQGTEIDLAPKFDQSVSQRLTRSAPADVMIAKYFRATEGRSCSFLNSDIPKSLVYKNCICLDGYHGPDCGIPRFVWAQLLDNGTRPMTLTRLRYPRKIVDFKYGLGDFHKELTLCGNRSNHDRLPLAHQRLRPDLEVYSGPTQSQFACDGVQAFSCASMTCCWNRYWTRATELSFTDLVIIDIGRPLGAPLPGDILEFFKFYEGFPEVLMIRRGPSVSVVASFKSVAIECNFDIKCIASCESSKFQVISLDL